jgi:4-hydroxy-tetrahydrodipicolinate reductase
VPVQQQETSAVSVLVNGFSGRMGRQVIGALLQTADLEIVGGVRRSPQEVFLLPDGSRTVPIFSKVDSAIEACHPRVVVDFTNADVARASAWAAASAGVNLVIGSTGLVKADLEGLSNLASQHQIGIVVAPNFAIGAVLLTYFARIAARHFDYAEIVETHHEKKIDSPSGTSLEIARSLNAGRSVPFQPPASGKQVLEGTRGGWMDGVPIHSIRMSGRLAHHELVLGGAGQTLTVRHDTIDRECYMPGVIAAIRAANRYAGKVVGMEEVLGLSGRSALQI